MKRQKTSSSDNLAITIRFLPCCCVATWRVCSIAEAEAQPSRDTRAVAVERAHDLHEVDGIRDSSDVACQAVLVGYSIGRARLLACVSNNIVYL
jgi:hypothetical protein